MDTSVTVEHRNRIGCINVEDGGARGDNLAIVLASYFSAREDRPKDDPDDVDTGWGVWVIDKTNRALERIAEATSQTRGQSSTGSATSVFERLKECLVHGQGVTSEVTPQSLLEDDLGLDSLDAIELALNAESAFPLSREISEQDILECKTVADAVALIERLSLPDNPAEERPSGSLL